MNYALKIIKKTNLTKKEHGYTEAEKRSMAKLDHPFIIKVFYAFQSQTRAYMALEYAEGGNLYEHMQENIATLKEWHFRFYIAELVLAIGHIHSLDIIHRDLKLENILLDRHGHIRLADFGLCIAHRETKKLYEQCGTLECQAPEVLKTEGYKNSCDWWSLGVLVYCMLFRKFPFDPKGQECQERVTSMKTMIKLKPKYKQTHSSFQISSAAKSFIKDLLVRTPEKRLGSGMNGFQNVKSHDFFKGCKNGDHNVEA